MALKPWYKVDGLQPREDLRENKPLDASEFAVHLDQVRDQRAPADYQEPERFFDRTYMTKNLTDLAAQVVRRLSGEITETSAVFHMITQFGGGKTHALTLLYHLAKNGPKATSWTGVSKILSQAGISTIPKSETAVFVGTEFDSLRGRGGNDGTPLRKTPWGEIAFQLGGQEAFDIVAEHDQQMQAPGGDVIREFLPKNKPSLILMDELVNYISRHRKSGMAGQLYHFIQNLSEQVRGMKGVVLAISIPSMLLEMTSEDVADFDRYSKMLDRLGKAVMVSAEAETSEIIRRRLFEWEPQAVSADGRILLPREAIATCNDYADWVADHSQQLPEAPTLAQARSAFTATYPFHPTILSVFERKWQSLPRFQRTRGVLRLLALWVANAYSEGWKGAHRDPLITLGTAPLDDPLFRAALLEQLGEDRLEGAITTDICGKRDSHAIRLDAEAIDAIKKGRLHRKAATSIFFESNGGCARAEATVPEIRMAVAEPSLDIGNIETVLEDLKTECYYLTVETTKYRFSLTPNLNKILADRRAGVEGARITERVRSEVQKVFTTSVSGVALIHFPQKSGDIPNRPVLTLAVLAPEQSVQDSETRKAIDSIIRESGTSDRTFKSAIVFAVADSDAQLKEEARKLLALEDIHDQDYSRLDDSQKGQLSVDLEKAKRDVKEAVWRTYRHVALLGKDNSIRIVDLGLVTSSSATSMTKLVIDRLRQDGDVEDSISSRFLVRNWSPAFTEWSTKAVRDACFASPQFPRLLDADSIKETIARGVRDRELGYVGKAGDGTYRPFYFNSDEPNPQIKRNLSADEVEISDEMFVIKADVAQEYIKRITDPPKLTTLIISPQQVLIQPETKQAFIVKGLDQYGKELSVDSVQWSATGGAIDQDGVLQTGTDPGNFNVLAKAGEISVSTTFTIPVKPTQNDDEEGEDEEPTLSTPQGLRWSGEVPTQKWMNFYSRVLSRYASDPNVKLTLKVEFSADGEVSEQKLQETITALQELGLESDVDLG